MRAKEITRGTIYWDESSRGDRPPGRWVGERYEHGRRVRFRSKDYAKVLAWAQEGDRRVELIEKKQQKEKEEAKRQQDKNFIPIVGFPLYKMDIHSGEVYGRLHRPIKADTSGRYRLWDAQHEHYDIGIGKVIWAVQHGVNPRAIPNDIIINREDDGKLTLHHAEEYNNNILRRNNSVRVSNREKRTVLAIKEGEILLRYYRTGDSSELLQYLMQQYEHLTEYVVKYKHFRRQRAQDIALAVIDHYCQMIENGTLAITTIRGNLQGQCKVVIEKQKLTKEYNEKL